MRRIVINHKEDTAVEPVIVRGQLRVEVRGMQGGVLTPAVRVDEQDPAVVVAPKASVFDVDGETTIVLDDWLVPVNTGLYLTLVDGRGEKVGAPRLVQDPAGEEPVKWGDLVDLDPRTLAPLTGDQKRTALEVLADAESAVAGAEQAKATAESAAADAEQAKTDLLEQKGQAEGIAPLDEDGYVLDANGKRQISAEAANAAYLTPDIAVERSATGAVVAIEQNGEPTTYARDATGAIIAYTRGGITHTITRTATGAIEGISA